MIARLAEPTYENGYAHSAGQSASPGLWPTYAWVPRLGPTGTVVHEVNRGAGMTMGTMTPAAGWQVDENGYNITGDGTVDDDLSTVDTFAQDTFTYCTFMAAFKQSSYTNNLGIFGRSGSNIAGRFSLLNGISANTLRCIVQGTILVRVVDTTGDATWFDGSWHVVAAILRPVTPYASLYVDGLLQANLTLDPGALTPAAGIKWEMVVQRTEELIGSVGAGLFYNRELSLSAIRNLSDDIMVPFRLKPRVTT